MTQQMTRTILEEFVDQHRGSLALFNREAQVVPGGVTHDARAMHPFTLFVRGAEGACKWDVDGHRLIDYIMGHGALLLGHAHPATVEAVREQIGHGTHYGAGHELEIAWSELVCSLVPSAERVQFTSSGTEATMLAMRLARAFTGKNTIVKFAGHFHGWHDYATAGVQPPYDVPTSLGVPPAVLASVVVAPPNDLAFVEQTLAENGDVAAVILEASGASWSTLPLPAGFLAELRALTERHGVLLIMDEVITGFRWSPGGVQAKEGITPDLTTLAKILAGGLPGGAVGGRADVMALLDFREDRHFNRFGRVAHPGTYNANPLSAAAGVAMLRLVSDPAVQARADALAARLRAGFNATLRRLGLPGCAYGESSVLHTVLGVEVANNDGGDLREPALDHATLKRGTPERLSVPFNCGMLLNGVDLFRGGGLVSAVHSEADIDATIGAFEATLVRMQQEGLFDA